MQNTQAVRSTQDVIEIDKKIYAYEKNNGSLTGMILASLVFGFGFTYLAITNRAELKILFFTLGSRSANVFYWCMALLFIFAIGLIVFQKIWASKEATRVELFASFADLPKASLFGGQIFIPYTAITKISREIVNVYETLTITSPLGNACVVASNFMSLEDYANFVLEITSRVQLARDLGTANFE